MPKREYQAPVQYTFDQLRKSPDCGFTRTAGTDIIINYSICVVDRRAVWWKDFLRGGFFEDLSSLWTVWLVEELDLCLQHRVPLSQEPR